MRRLIRLPHQVAFVASALALSVVAARPLDAPAPTEPLTPNGRVCMPRSFGGPPPAGPLDPLWFLNPGAMVVGPDSNLYSTSPSGGTNGVGTIFRITPAGQVTVLFNFDRTHGAGPQSGLVDGGDGWFYGTTYSGGFGVGTIFRIRPGDTAPQMLYRFRNGSTIGLKPDCPTGRCPYTGRQRADIAAGYPVAAPVRARNGVLYGVTPYSNNQIYGVLYSFAPPYDSTTFHALCIFDQRMKADTAMARFVCKPNIGAPGALILGRTGDELYGTTLGANGAVFRAATSGDVTLLHTFDLAGGSKPFNLTQASNGSLYGTTYGGGSANLGTVYRLNPASGVFTVMSSLHVGAVVQGLNPVGGLVEAVGDSDATRGVVPYLYGATKFGGKYGRGVLFRIPLDGDSLSFRVLHEFELYTTGRSTVTTPTLGPKGLLYGLTYQGGAFDGGAFYTLNPMAPPGVRTHDAALLGGVAATNDEGFPLNDPIVDVRTGVTASQTGVDSAGKPVTTSIDDGIMVRARCPNPHIVQFIFRERMSTLGYRIPGTYSPSSGSYSFTTLMPPAGDTVWRTDVPLKKDSAYYGRWDAYLDLAPGAAHQRTSNSAVIFDRPGFGWFGIPRAETDPRSEDPPYPLSGQSRNDAQSETWRITAHDYVMCNCQVTREVRWAREVHDSVASYRHIRVFIPAPEILTWINEKLRRDGYAPVP